MDYSRQFDDMNTALDYQNRVLDTMNNRIDRALQYLDMKPTIKQVMTLDNTNRHFDSRGYKYFGLWVAAQSTINLTLDGLTATITVYPGYNDLSIFQDCYLSVATANTTLQVIYIWTDLSR
jgi:hypothetical protein